MIVITGAAGFIASNLVRKLNDEGFEDLVLVDDFSNHEKNKNFEHNNFTNTIERDQFFDWLHSRHKFIQFIFHLGARTDTTEFDKSVFDRLNFNYSKKVWQACVEYGIPLIYASSAATYGMGELGYSDRHEIIPNLKPLNPYGESKNEFDKWVLKQKKKPYFWAGFKFFNVYGPNEYHKGRMASVVFHAYNQIKKTGKMKLFRSHHPGFKDGEQKRDFIYVNDVVDVMYYFLHNRHKSGIYNLGTGKARTFKDLTSATFSAMHKQVKIEFIDTPKDIRDKYQYFTQAEMEKIREAGYKHPFHTLESGIHDYVANYLDPHKYA